MKEKLKEFLIRECYSEMWYGASTESWLGIIDKFFDQYQPERSKREDYKDEWKGFDGYRHKGELNPPTIHLSE